jgi:hypothetical protein
MSAVLTLGGGTETRSTARSAAVEGARDILPLMVSVLPFGLAIGAVLAASSIGPVEALISGCTARRWRRGSARSRWVAVSPWRRR